MKIVFTSCARYTKRHQQKEWLKIHEENPDFLFLLGDNIYMDWGVMVYHPYFRNLRYFKRRMQQKYFDQWNNPNFKTLIDAMNLKNGLHGIWDDHDCGWNNVKVASLNPKNKAKIAHSKNQFFNHFPISKQHNSIYYAHDTALARFIFLDNRSFSKRGNEVYLGEEQLQFLEEKLIHNKPLTIISGGLTLGNGTEKFSTYKKEYQHFCELTSTCDSMVIYLAGDIHTNKFVAPTAGIKINGVLPPFEIISSGVPLTFKERKHNWAMLEINNANEITVSFYKRGIKQEQLSQNCTEQLAKYLRD